MDINANPWTSIGLLCGSQCLGAILIVWLFGIDTPETVIAIGLLMTGTTLALFFLHRPPSQRRKAWSLLLPILIYSLFIFALSNRNYIVIGFPLRIKLFHVVEYATLGIFLCWSWRPVLKKRGLFLFVLGVVSSGTLLGITDEIHQYFIPGRVASVSDVALDTISTALGCFIFLYIPSLKKYLSRSRVRGGISLRPESGGVEPPQ